MMTYQEAEAFIDQLPAFTDGDHLADERFLLEMLGNPQEKLRVVHVAGTNGKGSTCAFLEAIFRKSGKKTGLFTSPHLVNITERFQINREDVSREMFARVCTKVRGAVRQAAQMGRGHLTRSDVLFAVGMEIFVREEAEIVIMETGLGGRLDCTNIIHRPLICVITSISKDHTAYLGDTIEAIAQEKAGIIKPGVPVVYDAGCEAAAKVIEETAGRQKAEAVPCFPGERRIVARTEKSIDFVLDSSYYDDQLISVPFAAEYQTVNSALAMTAVRVLDPEKKISDEAAADAVAHTSWNGRMQQIRDGVFADGAHNEDGIAKLMDTVRYFAGSHPVSLLFTALADKDVARMIELLTSGNLFDHIVVTQVEGRRRMEAETLREMFARRCSCPVMAEADLGEAFSLALRKKTDRGILFCAGSLYLVGALQEIIISIAGEEKC